MQASCGQPAEQFEVILEQRPQLEEIFNQVQAVLCILDGVVLSPFAVKDSVITAYPEKLP
jgi:hypothetical protein